MFNRSEDAEIIESQEQNSQQPNNGTTAPESNINDENVMDVDEGAEVTPNPIRMNTNAQTDQLCLEILPSNNIPSHEAVFVNDPKLSDIRVYLSKAGLSTEFSAGMLYVNDAMRISRNAAGKFEIEGPASEDFYRRFLERTAKNNHAFFRHSSRSLQSICNRLVINSLLLLLLSLRVLFLCE